MLRNIVQKLAGSFGYKISKQVPDTKEFDADFLPLYQRCQPFTMTSIERMYALYKSIQYIAQNKIQGDFVECGVWRGGSSMMIALSLLKFGLTDRKIYLYDTYEGMSEPTEADKDFKGETANTLLKASVKDKENSVWCLAGIDDVRQNMRFTQYPTELVHFIKGKVEDMLPQQSPAAPLALLRLDTDWYESTRHELIHLYPLLQGQGVLILDDYGYWQGAKKAVDEYFEVHPPLPLLNRIDGTGRLAIKPI
jgi:O-methyltransferase